MDKSHVLTIMVRNNSGVLARVASLFGRRGYNIESLSVSATNDPSTSRMTVVVQGDTKILHQIILQTQKLEEVFDVYELDQANSFYRELVLVKVATNDRTRTSVREISDIYEAKIVDLSIASMVIELTGTPRKIDSFMTLIGQYPIIEMCRTGATALAR